MKRLVVLGAGTAGTMAANKMRTKLQRDEWNITVVDQATPLLPAGIHLHPLRQVPPDEIVSPTKRFLPKGVDLVSGEIDRSSRATNTSCSSTAPTSRTTTSSSRPAPRRARTRPRAWTTRSARQRPRVLHVRGRTALAEKLAHVGGRPARRPYHRDAHQVPGRAAGVHLPRRRVLRRAGHCATRSRSPTSRRCRARSPSRSRRRTSATCSSNRGIAARGRLHDRADRRRGQDADRLRRARDPLRPARHHPDQHGRRLSSCAPAWATTSTSSRSTSRRCSPRRTTTSSPSATRPTSPPPRPARSPTSRWTCSPRTSFATSQGLNR